MSDPYTVVVSRRSDGAFLTPPAVETRFNYTCAVCGTCDVWGPSWSWFGSYRDADRNPGAVPKFCADVCRDQWAEDNGL